MTASNERDERLKQVWNQAVDYLGLAHDTSELSVYYAKNLNPFVEDDGDTFVVEWLEGPPRWAYRSVSAGGFLPGTWTAPYEEKAIEVHFPDQTTP